MANPEKATAGYDVLIQGAGIAGLTLAIALQRRGYRVRVLERCSGLAELGAGIWMAANPMQVFDQLGFAEHVIDAGWAVKLLRLQDWKSGDIQVTDMSDIARQYGFETIALHRGILQKLLFERLASDSVCFGREIHSLSQSEDSVVADLSDGSRCKAAIVVGADGFNSSIRRMANLGGEKRYSGSSSYRAIARGASILPKEAEHEAYEIWAKGCRVGFSKIWLDRRRCACNDTKPRPGRRNGCGGRPRSGECARRERTLPRGLETLRAISARQGGLDCFSISLHRENLSYRKSALPVSTQCSIEGNTKERDSAPDSKNVFSSVKLCKLVIHLHRAVRQQAQNLRCPVKHASSGHEQPSKNRGVA